MKDLEFDDGIKVSPFAIVKNSNFDEELFTAILTEMTNGFGTKQFSIGVARQIMTEHRTLQQSIIRMFLEIITEYSKTDRGFDDRNQAAVETSKRITKLIEDENLYLPFI